MEGSVLSARGTTKEGQNEGSHLEFREQSGSVCAKVGGLPGKPRGEGVRQYLVQK